MYTTKQELIDTYGEEALIELTDRAEPETGEIDNDVLNTAINDASATVDAYIIGRYSPAAARDAIVLRSHAKAIAFYKLHRNNYDDETRRAYEDALEFLKSVSNGTAHLAVDGIQPASAPADARVEAHERMFSRDSLKAL